MTEQTGGSYSYTPYTRWFMLRRKRARLAAQEASQQTGTDVPEVPDETPGAY